MPQSADVGILEAALVGYRYKIKELEERIAGLRGKSDGSRQQITGSQVQPNTKNRGPRSAAGPRAHGRGSTKTMGRDKSEAAREKLKSYLGVSIPELLG